MDAIETLLRNAPWLATLWVTFVGACIGSFLNVVVYRLPLGMSLLHPGSRCPKCGHAIRWHDNLPVLGWLALRGRCRDCGAAIATRYPLVEATVALVFCSFWFRWLFANEAVAFDRVALQQALGQFLHASTVVTVLLAVALIVRDGQRVPLSLLGAGLGPAVGLVLVHPTPRRMLVLVGALAVGAGLGVLSGWRQQQVRSRPGASRGERRRKPHATPRNDRPSPQPPTDEPMAVAVFGALATVALGLPAGAVLLGAALLLHLLLRLLAAAFARHRAAGTEFWRPGPAEFLLGTAIVWLWTLLQPGTGF